MKFVRSNQHFTHLVAPLPFRQGFQPRPTALPWSIPFRRHCSLGYRFGLLCWLSVCYGLTNYIISISCELTALPCSVAAGTALSSGLSIWFALLALPLLRPNHLHHFYSLMLCSLPPALLSRLGYRSGLLCWLSLCYGLTNYIMSISRGPTTLSCSVSFRRHCYLVWAIVLV
jgi:hypothetical protein